MSGEWRPGDELTDQAIGIALKRCGDALDDSFTVMKTQRSTEIGLNVVATVLIELVVDFMDKTGLSIEEFTEGLRVYKKIRGEMAAKIATQQLGKIMKGD